MKQNDDNGPDVLWLITLITLFFIFGLTGNFLYKNGGKCSDYLNNCETQRGKN